MAIKRIFSAGGIVIRKSTRSTKGTEGTRGIEVLVTQHSKHKGWDFPKGHREIYESEEQTALREVEEETGVKGEIIERAGETKYFYWEEGPDFAPSTSFDRTQGKSLRASSGKQKVLKTVVFYLMRYKSDGDATTAFEVSDHAWLPIDEVEDRLTFKDTKEMWRKARAKIELLFEDRQ
ncbi:NUDIX domain-containing protein [Candidatus Curtissbacteria bacterium]|nr:NUDIX domain-containing protein [Candidatus Curtissbacteria bacterium]